MKIENEFGTSLESALAEHPFTQGLNSAHLRALADNALRIHCEPEEVIFHEGDPANRFYLLGTGRVSIEARRKEAGTLSIQTLGPGDVFGWSWLFPPYYWHFDAKALDATEAIFLYGTRLREQCEKDCELGYQLLKRMTSVIIHRLQSTQKRLFAVKFHAQVKTPGSGSGPKQIGSYNSLRGGNEASPRDSIAMKPETNIDLVKHPVGMGRIDIKGQHTPIASEEAPTNGLGQMLRAHPVFSEIKTEHLSILAKGARTVNFEPGQLLFREGEPATQLYLVQSGHVAIEAHDPGDGSVLVETIGAGEVLGWSWLFPPFVWHFRARTIESTTAIVLSGAHLLNVAEGDHEFGFTLMKCVAQILIHRLQATRKQLLAAELESGPS